MAAPHFDRRLKAIKAAINAPDHQSAAVALLQLAAKWTPAAFSTLLGDALELASWQGREAVFLDEDDATFADETQRDLFSQPFKEQIDFFKQKRVKPTKSFTDAVRGVHDRALVIAGATDLAMLSDFQTALSRAMEDGTTLAKFREDFDAIVSKYGWQYKGEKAWRTRVIFETNMRTAYMAGRLKQMRDPDVLKLRPYWQYRHGETRTPKFPRPSHEALHGTTLHYSDPFWKTHFPPNDYLCSCGVRSLSLRDLKRQGKDGPDPSPEALMEPIIDPVTGKLTEQPQGVGYGWDYMPGDLWEQGLTPSALFDEGAELLHNPRMAVSIDVPEPLDDLLKAAKPFKAKPMDEGLAPEEYVKAFLEPFGGEIGKAVMFEDKAGTKMPVSDQLFRDRAGELKVMKRGRHLLTRMIAETLIDPDEIWMGVARKVDPVDGATEELIVDRRYIRVDALTGLQVVFEIGEKFWEAVTSYNPTTKKGAADLKALDKRRGGKLLYKRK